MQYDMDFLKRKGYFQDKDCSEFKEVENSIIDRKNKIVYIENTSVKRISDVIKIKKQLDEKRIDWRYIWIVSSKLYVLRKYGENKRFIFKEHARSDTIKSKKKKLEKIDKSLNTLFDVQDIVDKFYRELFKISVKLAKSIKTCGLDFKKKMLVSQKTIDRLMFIYFLLNKGLIKIYKEDEELKEDDISPQQLFPWIYELKKNSTRFYDFLHEMFFEYMNREYKDRENEKLKIGYDKKTKAKYYLKIPYLNGSLFEPLKAGFDESKGIFIKFFDWKRLFELFMAYNWILTDEDEEDETKGNLTPEILGNVYEKFVITLEKSQNLSEDKIDQIIRSRLENKKIGAYYTPEQITNYISRNTIWPFIKDKLKINEKYLDFDDFYKHNFRNKRLLKKILKELKNITICDNACGSGSFLMAASEILLDWRKKCGDSYSDYEIKEQIVTNNLYGVDIMRNAVEIAKLRLWLWLISSQSDVDKIKPLPNIDYNILQGNSLIGYVDINEVTDKIEKSNLERYLRGRAKASDYLNSLAELINKYKNLHGDEKHKTQKKIDSIIFGFEQILNGNFTKELYSKICSKKKLQKRSKFEDLLNKIKKDLLIFHWGLMFYEIFHKDKPKEERGFDIIIGNPPYGQNKLRKVEEIYLSKSLCCIGKKSEGGTRNLAPVFTEKAKGFLKNGGHLGFIINNSVCRVDEFQKFRKFLLEKTNLYEIVDEGNPFKESGVTLEMVTIFYKKGNININTLKILSRRFETVSFIEKKKFARHDRFILYLDNFYDKILKQSSTNVLYGKRGGDIKFTKNKIEKSDIPYLFSGKCVKKYYLDEKYFYWVSKKQNLSPTFKEDYNNQFIITTKISDRYRAYIKPKKSLIGNNVIKVFIKNKQQNIKYILAILNSKLMDYIVKRYLINYSELTVAFYNSILKVTPIKEISEKNQKPFINLVDKILSITKSKDYLDNSDKQAKVKRLEKEIDQLVYKLYGLTKEEINVIEENLK